MDPDNSWISQHHLLRTDYGIIASTSTVFIVRVIAQVRHRRTVEAQDVLLYIAFAAYLAFAILYVVITPVFFKIDALEKGEIAPWPSMPEDVKLTSEVMWQSGMEYWTCLWFVKFSLLALYKKLLLGMPNVYRWIWWGTLIFCILVSNAVCKNIVILFEETWLTCRRHGLLALSLALA